MIKGGKEQPCIKGVAAAAYERATGFPCYLRDLDEDNVLAANLVSYAVGEATRCFIEPTLRLSGLLEHEQANAIERAAHALRHPKVTARLYPKPETAEGAKGCQ